MKENKRPGQQLKGLSVQDLLGVSGEESAMEIDIRLIHPFKDHPFKVLDDDKMQDLVESIQANGVLSPVLLREAGRGQYEMISGHRRMHAAQLAGLETIPAIIREMSDDEATIIMVDSNIQREELLPSEKAFAFKMRMDAIKHQGTTFGHDVQKWSHEDIGAESGFSGRQVNRYIRLTELIPELLDMVDAKRITFVAGVEISYIDQSVQKWLCEYIHDNGVIKPEQIAALRKRLESGMINQSQMIMVLNDKERTYVRYVNGQRIKHTVKPVLGEKAAHNNTVVYSMDFQVTPHQLRHTYITNLIYAAVDPKTVQYLAGHENSKITMDIYAKVKYNRPQELAAVVNGAFNKG